MTVPPCPPTRHLHCTGRAETSALAPGRPLGTSLVEVGEARVSWAVGLICTPNTLNPPPRGSSWASRIPNQNSPGSRGQAGGSRPRVRGRQGPGARRGAASPRGEVRDGRGRRRRAERLHGHGRQRVPTCSLRSEGTQAPGPALWLRRRPQPPREASSREPCPFPPGRGGTEPDSPRVRGSASGGPAADGGVLDAGLLRSRVQGTLRVSPGPSSLHGGCASSTARVGAPGRARHCRTPWPHTGRAAGRGPAITPGTFKFQFPAEIPASGV